MENQVKPFGQVLRELRIKAGLTQEELAARLDYNSSGYISRLELGTKKPSVELLFRLADALEIEAWEIVQALKESRQSLHAHD
jgi:transcriptional regulator with XRE-family HTH domain